MFSGIIKNKNWFIFFILILTVSISSLAKDGKGARITWKKIPGVSRYIVEVKNEQGKIIYKKRTGYTFSYADLSPGNYKVRIRGFSKSGKQYGKSDWFNLKILKAVEPEADRVHSEKIFAGEKIKTIEISGSNFIEGCEVRLKKEGKVSAVENVEIISPERISFDIKPAALGPGSYDVIIINPGGKETVVPDAVNITSQPSPVISCVFPGRVSVKSGNKKVSISGRNFNSRSEGTISRKGFKAELPLVFNSSKKLEFVIDTSKFVKGHYNIRIKNPEDLDYVKTNALRLIDPEDGLLSLYGLYIGIGYQYTIVLPRWDSVLSNSFLGLSLNISYCLGGIPKLSNIPFVRNLGFDLKSSYMFFTDQSIAGSKMQIGSVGAGIHFRENFNLPVYFILRAIGGLTFSRLRKTFNGNDGIVESTDFFIDAEFAVLYPFKYYYFLEFGTGYMNGFFAEQDMRLLSFFARIGLRL